MTYDINLYALHAKKTVRQERDHYRTLYEQKCNDLDDTYEYIAELKQELRETIERYEYLLNECNKTSVDLFDDLKRDVLARENFLTIKKRWQTLREWLQSHMDKTDGFHRYSYETTVHCNLTRVLNKMTELEGDRCH